jgi:two-component system chemotaxis response regulator CheB
MPTKVLIVDDSSFFRKRLKEIIESDPTMSVVGEAKDGKEGVDMTVKLRPDVITMDVEMPVMDGITSVKEIMAKCPTPVLMFSSLTHEGASATFKALEAGAIDFMPKNFDDIAHRREDATKALIQSIKTVSRSRVRRVVSSTLSSARPATSTVASARLATTTAARPSLATATTARPGAASTLSRPSTLASRTAPASAPASSSASATSGAALGQFKKISDLLVQVLVYQQQLKSSHLVTTRLKLLHSESQARLIRLLLSAVQPVVLLRFRKLFLSFQNLMFL